MVGLTTLKIKKTYIVDDKQELCNRFVRQWTEISDTIYKEDKNKSASFLIVPPYGESRY